MSAWIASDKHIASFVFKCANSSDDKQAIANLLKKANIRSVNYRYDERTKITPCDLNQVQEITWEEACMLGASLDYQSCQRPDWENSKAYHLLNRLRAEAGYMASNKKSTMWSL